MISLKAKEIAEAVKRHYRFEDNGQPTCDGFVYGDPETEVTGVITTFTVTADVLREAVARGANMIITHEPTFFLECRGEWGKEDAVFAGLRALLQQAGAVIWRCHDMMHGAVPDDIYSGFLEAMGWESLAKPPVEKDLSGEGGFETFLEGFEDYYEIQPTTLAGLAGEMKEKLGMGTVRVAGDPEAPCTRAAVLVGGGSLGFGRMPDMPLRLMGLKNIDVIVCGEIAELLLGTYMQDAASLGLPRSMIVLGHERSEEWGMRFMQGWLAKEVSVPVYFVNAQEPFWYL